MWFLLFYDIDEMELICFHDNGFDLLETYLYEVMSRT